MTEDSTHKLCESKPIGTQRGGLSEHTLLPGAGMNTEGSIWGHRTELRQTHAEYISLSTLGERATNVKFSQVCCTHSVSEVKRAVLPDGKQHAQIV